MKKILLSLLMLMAATVSAISQESESVIELSDVQIEVPSNKTIIKKAIGNLKKLTKRSLDGGNGQWIQIMESNGSTVQLSREYGYWFSSGYNTKRSDEWDYYWRFKFAPVYNARSLRYDSDGKDVLTRNYDSPDEDLPHPNNFDARARYISDIIRLIYLYGPVYSRNRADYSFSLKDVTGDSYVFSFESSDRYPLKNPLYAKGELEIDVRSMKLKSIWVENMGIRYAARTVPIKLQLKRYPDYMNERFLKDCVDCHFSVNSEGSVDYALIHVLWRPSNTQFNCGMHGSQPRPNLDGTDFMVTECFKKEPFSPKPDNNTQDVSEITSAFKTMDLGLYGLYTNPDGSTYNPDAIDAVNWALDVSDAERQLDMKMPIREQYRIQATDYHTRFDESLAKGEYDDELEPESQEVIDARRKVHRWIRETLFDDPLHN